MYLTYKIIITVKSSFMKFNHFFLNFKYYFTIDFAEMDIAIIGEKATPKYLIHYFLPTYFENRIVEVI